MPDWSAIRQEYESGISQRSLATKYNISQAAISKKASKERWVIVPVIIPQNQVISDNSSELPELEIVQKALNHLATFLDGDGLIGLNQHKLFADALCQYIKLKLIIPTEQENSPYDLRDVLRYCTDEELAIIEPIIKAANGRKEAEASKVKPIRRAG